FFFQAEDGIRDFHVTGVQTCALPILGMLFSMEMTPWDGWSGISVPTRNYAHLHSTAVITDTANWILVQGSFVADSAYRFLAIGRSEERRVGDGRTGWSEQRPAGCVQW